MLKPFRALVEAVATERLILDSSDSRFRWEDEWAFVTQAGEETRSNELQDYRPAQVGQGLSVTLALSTQRTPDGAILIREDLAKTLPGGFGAAWWSN